MLARWQAEQTLDLNIIGPDPLVKLVKFLGRIPLEFGF
jgi:hypothetical protein